MSHDFTFISDLNKGSGMMMRGTPINHQKAQSGPSQMVGGMSMQGVPMNNQHAQMGGPDQFEMLRKYLAESANESDSDSDSDSDEEGSRMDGNWQHYYGIATLIMLAIIMYYVFKIRKELLGMYEEV